MKAKDLKVYYDAFDLAKMLRVHHKTILRWGRIGRIPSFKISNRRYYPKEELDKLIKEDMSLRKKL